MPRYVVPATVPKNSADTSFGKSFYVSEGKKPDFAPGPRFAMLESSSDGHESMPRLRELPPEMFGQESGVGCFATCAKSAFQEASAVACMQTQSLILSGSRVGALVLTAPDRLRFV